MIRIEIDRESTRRLEEILEGLNPKDQSKAVFKGFKQAAILVERRLKLNLSGNILQRRTGHLRASIGSIVETSSDGLVAVVGSGVRQGKRLPYADIQETGGTVRPSVKSWLTIPLSAAKTSAGVTRFTAQDVKNGNTKYEGSFIRNGIIFGKTRRKITPLFVLKKSVQIRPSKYLSITKEETAREVSDEMIKAAKEAITPKE